MFIKLTPRAAFWSLVDPVSRKLIVHLTFQDPGPKEVNYDKLDKYCKQILNAGLQHGNIMQVADPKAKAKPQVEHKEEDKKGQEDTRVETQKLSAEEFLKQGVRGIRDQLREGTFGAEFLSRAIELEKAEKKPRKTVLTSLEQKLNKVGGATAVTETEEEQIEIQLA